MRGNGMTDTADTATAVTSGASSWYLLGNDEVAARLDVDLEAGLTSAEAAARLERDGPNELPVEKPVPGWRRYADQYRNYMQIILVGAALLSLVIGEFSTALVVFLIT